VGLKRGNERDSKKENDEQQSHHCGIETSGICRSLAL